MKPILCLLALALTGCTYVSHTDKGGSRFIYFSSKDIQLEEADLGDGRKLKGLNSDASSMAGKIAEGVASGANPLN
jgi:hypothetical protein